MITNDDLIDILRNRHYYDLKFILKQKSYDELLEFAIEEKLDNYRLNGEVIDLEKHIERLEQSLFALQGE